MRRIAGHACRRICDGERDARWGCSLFYFTDLCLEGGMRDRYVHSGVYLFLADVWFGRVLRATGALRGARAVILLSRFIVGWQVRLAYPGIVICNGIGQACLDWLLPLLVSLVGHLDPAFSNPTDTPVLSPGKRDY